MVEMKAARLMMIFPLINNTEELGLCDPDRDVHKDRNQMAYAEQTLVVLPPVAKMGSYADVLPFLYPSKVTQSLT